MCRSQSTETIRFDHISRGGDAIGIKFFKTKSQQEGTTNKDPRHCYGNPLKPGICLFVALGLCLSCNSQTCTGALFPGSKQKDRFGKSLARMLGCGTRHDGEE
ncbi:hypothetical protein Ae201684_001160 [Aphanomyces euteiches]|uniref:Uncharacterized protein n=1 Tax=Aphanomyces euteiches TaxID=100861 RepID=A0A6G0XVK3_9STRA|nr:hypothetical protein Ae201684_001160 [Aphanomyces euteiches]